MDYTYHYDSPLGAMTMASDGDALIGLWFDGQKYFGSTLRRAPEEKTLPVFEEAARWLDIYFNGQAPDFTPKLSMRTTAFRKAVWEKAFWKIWDATSRSSPTSSGFPPKRPSSFPTSWSTT